MKTHLLGLMGAVIAAAALSTCKEDPTKSLAGSPDSLIVSLNPIVLLDQGDTTRQVVASVVDESGSPLAATVTASSAAPTVAAVAPDNSAPDPTGTHSSFTVTGRQLGTASITFSGAGRSTTARANVLPSAFLGAASTRTPKGGDTITLHATTQLKFAPAARFFFPGNRSGISLAASAESLRVLMPYLGSDFGADSVFGVNVTYVPGLDTLRVPIEPNIVQTGDFWAGDDAWKTAPDISPILPASGDSAKMLVGIALAAFDTLTNNRSICPEFVLKTKLSRLNRVKPFPPSMGPCMIFKFTVAAPTSLNFTTGWVSGNAAGTNPDIDTYACSDSTVANFGTACWEDGGAGTTSPRTSFGTATNADTSRLRANPESTGPHLYPAGTHYFVIEYFAACNERKNAAGVPTACVTNGQQSNYFVTITRP